MLDCAPIVAYHHRELIGSALQPGAQAEALSYLSRNLTSLLMQITRPLLFTALASVLGFSSLFVISNQAGSTAPLSAPSPQQSLLEALDNETISNTSGKLWKLQEEQSR